MCCDRKEIECKMWTGNTQFTMPSEKDTRSQSKPNQVEVRILFCPFPAFSKFRASHRDFFLFCIKWYIKSSFFRRSFDYVCMPKPYNKLYLNSLKSSSYKKVFYSRSKILKMQLTSEIFEDFIRLLV